MSQVDAGDSLLGHVPDIGASLPTAHAAQVERLLARRSVFPHALLISGGTARDLARLADALAVGLLCDAPQADGTACGVCAACRLLAAGNHPDLLRLRPLEADEAAGRKASSQIRIEAVRQLIGTLALSPHHGRCRVCIIDPAEAMNSATANALLKVLEEPPAGNVLLLLSRRPMRLLPTLRSRCLPIRLIDESTMVKPGDGVEPEMVAFLRDADPDPVARAPWPAQRALVDALARGEGLGVPAASRISGLTLPAALAVLSRWTHDLARVKAGGVPRFLPFRAAELARVAALADLQGILHMGKRLAEWQRHADHPLIAPLTVADILLEYRAELFPTARTAA